MCRSTCLKPSGLFILAALQRKTAKLSSTPVSPGQTRNRRHSTADLPHVLPRCEDQASVGRHPRFAGIYINTVSAYAHLPGLV